MRFSVNEVVNVMLDGNDGLVKKKVGGSLGFGRLVE